MLCMREYSNTSRHCCNEILLSLFALKETRGRVQCSGGRATLLHKEQCYVTAVNPTVPASAFEKEDLLPIFPVGVWCGERGASSCSHHPSNWAETVGASDHISALHSAARTV